MKTTKLWNAMLILVSVLMFTGCGDDDKPVIKKTDGLRLANGFYMKKSDADPLATNVLASEKVEDGFGTKDREGFFGNYMFLKKGSYQMVEVKDKKIATTMGGSATTAKASESECKLEDVTVVSIKTGGAGVKIPADGLYKVTYDKTLAEMIIYKIDKAVIIGDATDAGWSHKESHVMETKTKLTAENGVTLHLKDVVIRVTGSFKIRFNCSWKINRSDKAGRPKGKGYNSFTNLGGTIDNLVPGGKNFKVKESGKYTVELKWTPKGGFKLALKKTGNVKVIFPDQMFLVGGATAYGWDKPGTKSDAIMHKIAGGVKGVFWKILHLEAKQGFKISNKDWKAPNIGHEQVKEFDKKGVTVTADKDKNMSVATSGMYMVVVDVRGGINKVSVIAPKVYGMGDGAFTNWTENNPNNLFTVDIATKSIVSPALKGAGEIRTYVDHEWFKDWWNAEFIPKGGKILYRNDGGDQERVKSAAGKKITYYFDTNKSNIQ